MHPLSRDTDGAPPFILLITNACRHQYLHVFAASFPLNDRLQHGFVHGAARWRTYHRSHDLNHGLSRGRGVLKQSPRYSGQDGRAQQARLSLSGDLHGNVADIRVGLDRPFCVNKYKENKKHRADAEYKGVGDNYDMRTSG